MKAFLKHVSLENKHFFCSKIISQNVKRVQCKMVDGKALANKEQDHLKEEIQNWINNGNRAPHLSVIVVGDNPSNETYVNMKCKAANYVGITYKVHKVQKNTKQADLLEMINDMNHDSTIDGILVQLPLSEHIDTRDVCNAVNPEKDVDGFSANNLGKLCLNKPKFIPCTALAVHHIVSSLGDKLSGKKAIVCGRSKHVGLPIALLLHSSIKFGYSFKPLNMTTTICHRHTPSVDLINFMKDADLIVSAVGQPNLIRGNMVKPGAVVIDVGFSQIYENGKKQLVGDVNMKEVSEVASVLSPVPGGVGPVTVAKLLTNTLLAAKSKVDTEKFIK